MHDTPPSLPDFAQWPSFPFEGDLRVKQLDDPVPVEPPRRGEGHRECTACSAPDEAYIWVGERWRVRAMDRPTGLPMVLILESRSHLDLGDLPNLLAAELGVMTVRLERAIRSLDGVARVHVNRWGDGSAHLHMWFLARPLGQLQLRGTFLPLWDSILPPIPESTWRENLAMVAAWLAEFGGRPLAAPPRIQWQAPASFSAPVAVAPVEEDGTSVLDSIEEAQPGYVGTADGGDSAVTADGTGKAAGSAEAGGRSDSTASGADSTEPADRADNAAGTGETAGIAGNPAGIAGNAAGGSTPAPGNTAASASTTTVAGDSRPASADTPGPDAATAANSPASAVAPGAGGAGNSGARNADDPGGRER